MTLRAFPVVYASDVEAVASFWELLGFRRHVQLPPEGDPGYVGLTRENKGELGSPISNGPSIATGCLLAPALAFEMYVYVDDLEAMLARLIEANVDRSLCES